MKQAIIALCLTISVINHCIAQKTMQTNKEGRAQELMNIFKNPKKFPSHVFVSAHRAGWRLSPENSLEAIEHSIKSGIDIAEIDLKKTKDGVLILMHDQTLDRTTTGHGRVEDWTLDSLKKLALKNPIGTITSYKIPTLEEALILAKGKILIDLDKSYPYIRDAFEIGKKTKTLDQIIFRVDDDYKTFLGKHGDIIRQINYMPLLWGKVQNPDAFVSAYLSAEHKPAIIEILVSDDNAVQLKFIEKIKNQNIRIMMNPCIPYICAGHDDELALTDPDNAWGWLIRNGATVLGTDRPDLLQSYLTARK